MDFNYVAVFIFWKFHLCIFFLFVYLILEYHAISGWYSIIIEYTYLYLYTIHYVGKTIFSLNELIFILLNVQEIETFYPA